MNSFKEIRIGAYVLRFWPSDNGWMCGITPEMMDAIEQAEKQEPVAWMSSHDVGFKRSEFGDTPTVPLYTTPQPQEFVCSTGLCHYKPQREWVGLTDEDEIDWDGGDLKSLVKAIEAKLKQKNGYAEEKNT